MLSGYKKPFWLFVLKARRGGDDKHARQENNKRARFGCKTPGFVMSRLPPTSQNGTPDYHKRAHVGCRDRARVLLNSWSPMPHGSLSVASSSVACVADGELAGSTRSLQTGQAALIEVSQRSTQSEWSRCLQGSVRTKSPTCAPRAVERF